MNKKDPFFFLGEQGLSELMSSHGCSYLLALENKMKRDWEKREQTLAFSEACKGLAL